AASPQLSRARLSPDGSHLASLIENDGDTWLVVMNLKTQKALRISPGKTINGLSKEVGSFRWLSDDRISFLTTVWDGSMWTGVSAVDSNGKRWAAFAGPDVDPRDLKPLVARQIIHSFEDAGQNVLMIDLGSHHGADLVFPDIVKVSTLTGRSDRVVKNPGNVVHWVVDHNGVVRLGVTREGLRFGVIYRENEQAPWRTLPLFDEARGKVTPLGFDYGDQRLIVAATNEQKRRAVYYYDPTTGKLGDMIAGHESYDIVPDRGAASLDGITLAGPVGSDLVGTVVGIRYFTEGPRVRWFDPGLEILQKAIDNRLPGTVNLIVSRSRDEKRFLVLAFSDRDPGTYYLVDLASEKPGFSRIGQPMPNFPVDRMAAMLPIKYQARDGETIHGYLTLPSGDRKKNLPLVVMPHGGPTVRDIWAYNPTVQFLASRGYAVLQVNFRGSPGYGSEFYEKGKREIGRGIQTDIDDGTRWAIAHGFADPARVAIVGSSYGGYSALFALAHSPELYRCGISINGVTDWTDIVRERKGEEYRYAYLHFQEWIGDPKTDANFLASISPVTFA
ncbi:MAG TPA: alpha/beta fold hydrolase, partial [Opitutus sp.]|nr:alpha/beta fold hydrolase [Opitutus sp.]